LYSSTRSFQYFVPKRLPPHSMFAERSFLIRCLNVMSLTLSVSTSTGSKWEKWAMMARSMTSSLHCRRSVLRFFGAASGDIFFGNDAAKEMGGKRPLYSPGSYFIVQKRWAGSVPWTTRRQRHGPLLSFPSTPPSSAQTSFTPPFGTPPKANIDLLLRRRPSCAWCSSWTSLLSISARSAD
jgi:hypothetical protein